MLIRITLLIFVLGLANIGFGQKSKLLGWEKLEVNKLSERKDTVNEITFDIPIFTESQIKLDGTKASILGYLSIIKVKDEKIPALYLLQRYNQRDYGSEYPLDAIIEIQFKKIPKSVNPKDKRVVKGTLVLNDDDFMHPFYILENAKVKK